MWSQEKPILNIEIYEGANLLTLDPELVPMLSISSDDSEVRTKLATKDQENFIWNEKLSLVLTPKSDIFIKLCNAADKNKVIKKIKISFNDLAESGKAVNKWLDFGNNDDNSLSFSVTGILATGLLRHTGSAPQVRVSLNFDPNNYLRIVSAEVNSHKIILKNRQVYTVYYANIVRNDEKCWVKAFRFSEIYELKSSLEKVEHGLKQIEMYGKTYFEFLACVWPSLGRFHPSTIEKRKIGIQSFLNYIIERQRNLDNVITLLNS
jgi:hypothetical protein